MQYIEQPISVYIEINEQGYITKVFSSDFEKPTATSIKIDEGFGDRYRHAQNHYFDKPLYNAQGGYNYKYANGKIYE